MTDRFEHVAAIYEQIFPARPAQLDFLEKARPESAPELFVDFACGSGTHLEALCDRGFEVFGIDLAPSMLSRLRERRPDLGPRVRGGDMRAADRLLGDLMPGPAGLVYSIGNSLALLGGREAIFETLLACRRLLHKKGAVVFQVINFDRIIDSSLEALPPLERKLADGQVVTLERSFQHLDADRLTFRTRLSSAAGCEERDNVLFGLTREIFAEILAESGFNSVRFRGDYDSSDWTVDSPATIVRAR